MRLCRHNLRASAAGFSLIELFAAMAILMSVVSMMGIIFTDSDRAWTMGTGRADNNTAGRAAISMIGLDLQYAIADDLITYVNRRDRFGLMSLAFTNDEVCAVTLQNDSRDGHRTAREVHYYVREIDDPESPARYDLIKGYYSADLTNVAAGDLNTFHAYSIPNWYDSSGGGPGRPGEESSIGNGVNRVIAENVVGFNVFATDEMDNVWSTYYSGDATVYPYVDHSNRVPKYIDIFLEVLDQRYTEQVSDMTYRGIDEEEIKTFVEMKARRYTTRVHFYNRSGYKPEHTWPEKYDQGRLY